LGPAAGGIGTSSTTSGLNNNNNINHARSNGTSPHLLQMIQNVATAPLGNTKRGKQKLQDVQTIVNQPQIFAHSLFQTHEDPFIRAIYPVLGPLSLEHSESTTITKYTFLITSEVCKKLNLIADSQLQIRSFHKDDLKRITEYPSGISFRVNNRLVTIERRPPPSGSPNAKKQEYPDKPVLLNSYCKEGANTLEIIAASCCCSYLFAMYIIDYFTIIELADKIRNEKIITYQKVFDEVLQSFKGESDIMQVSQNITLRCPLSKCRISTPVRAISCKHIQCFDLNSYAQMNRNTPKWRCPVCNQHAPFKDLFIDQYFDSILHQITDPIDTVETVIISPNGSWSIAHTDASTRKRKVETTDQYASTLSASSKPAPTIIDLTEDDSNEQGTKSKTNSTPSTSTQGSSYARSPFINIKKQKN